MNFSSGTILSTVEDLRRAFRNHRLELAPGGSLKVSGEVTLAHNVAFAGACVLDGPIVIDTGSVLTDVVLGPGCRVRAYSVISDLVAGERNLFGPFCFVRDGCRVDDDAILGAHVEAARSTFGSGVKVSHRAFIGDAEVGERTIIGAGVVFCNYDGKGRRPSIVGADATLGSGSLIIAPRSIGKNAVVAAGSVLTRDVAEDERVIQRR